MDKKIYELIKSCQGGISAADIKSQINEDGYEKILRWLCLEGMVELNKESNYVVCDWVEDLELL